MKTTKRILYILIFICSTVITSQEVTLSDKNFVHTIEPQQAVTIDNVNNVGGLGAPASKRHIESITYYDGLGRPIQAIGIAQSPLSNDIITHISYDTFGRQNKEFLPYSDTNTPGFLRTGDQEFATQTYYKSKYPKDFIGVSTANTNPYTHKEYEAATSGRILKQAAPGEAWKLGNGHEIKLDYKTNNAEEVRMFEVNSTDNTSPELNGLSYYNKNQLYKSIVKSQNWLPNQQYIKDHTTEEFRDKQGKIVLKRSYNNGIPHDTYYVYNDFGNLTYVLPPKVDITDGISDTELAEMCYQYRYDKRNRLVEKKIPGKDWEYIIYNKLDLPILTQDANLREENKWLFTKYDAFGRVAYTGLLKFNENTVATRIIVQHQADQISTQFVTKPNGSPGFIAGTTISYSNDAYPIDSIHKIYTINYYDNYVFSHSGVALPTTVLGQTVTTNVKGLPTGSMVRVLGTSEWITSITGYDNKARAIYGATNNPLLKTKDIVETKVDFVGKVLEAKSTHSIEKTICTFELFSGQQCTTSIEETIVVDHFDYDHSGRLLTQKQTINGQPQEMIVNNHYDELGLLKSKDVGNTEASPLQKVDYTYNVRGWLKGINDIENLDNDLFSFKINYDQQEGAVQFDNLYNGNISQTIWRTASIDPSTGISAEKRGYSYEYDALNRIKRGVMRKGDQLDVYTRHHLRKVAYDKNGNITKLQRDNAIAIMDDLSYAYTGNQLLSVIDAITGHTEEGFKDGNTIGDDYKYDDNGNMVVDKNKGISSIEYNHLNLPVRITFGGNESEHQSTSGTLGTIGPIPFNPITIPATITYTYDATGTKLSKQVNSGGLYSTLATTNYAGNYIYERTDQITGVNDPFAIRPQFELKFFSHPEGYIEPKENGTFPYIYQYKDHLGNIRLSYADDNNDGLVTFSEIREENNYYPFGLKHKGYNNLINGRDHKYEYNGIEIEESLDYNMMEMGMRQYDPAIARWVVMDPITHHNLSPYNTFDNNPIFWADPSGANSENLVLNLWNATPEDGSTKWYNTGNGGFSTNKPDSKQNSQDKKEYIYVEKSSLMSELHLKYLNGNAKEGLTKAFDQLIKNFLGDDFEYGYEDIDILWSFSDSIDNELKDMLGGVGGDIIESGDGRIAFHFKIRSDDPKISKQVFAVGYQLDDVGFETIRGSGLNSNSSQIKVGYNYDGVSVSGSKTIKTNDDTFRYEVKINGALIMSNRVFAAGYSLPSPNNAVSNEPIEITIPVTSEHNYGDGN